MNQRPSGSTTQHQNEKVDVMELEGLELDQRQTLAYAEWQRLAVNGRAPFQRDFRPDQIARALPSAMLLHVNHTGSGIRFQQRLEGRIVVLALGEGSGKDIETIYTDEHLDHMMPRYLESAATGDAAMTSCTAPQRDGKPFDFTRLILPFRAQDGSVNRLLVVFRFEAVSLSRLPGPLTVRRDVFQTTDANAALPIRDMINARQAG